MQTPSIVKSCYRQGLAVRRITGLRPRASAFASSSRSAAGPLSSHTPKAKKPSSHEPTTPTPFSTVNADEISHFSKLSSQWWDERGEFALLHQMNPTRVEYVRQKVAIEGSREDEVAWNYEQRHGDVEREARRGQGRWLSGMKVLDVGCGGGLLAESLARLGGDTLAIDASASNIAIAELHASQDPFLPFGKAATKSRGSLHYKHTSAEALRDAGERFDVVCSMEVLEHVDEPREFLKCLGEMVKPGGHLVLSTISRTPLSQLLTLTLAEDVLGLVTPGTHTYNKFIKPSELRRFFHDEMGGHDVWEQAPGGSDAVRDEVGETRGIVYDPLKSRWRLWGAKAGWGKEAGEGCNYMFHVRKRKDV